MSFKPLRLDNENSYEEIEFLSQMVEHKKDFSFSKKRKANRSEADNDDFIEILKVIKRAKHQDVIGLGNNFLYQKNSIKDSLTQL